MKTFVKLVWFASALAVPVRALCSSAWVARAFVGAQGYVQTDDGVYAARDLPPGERLGLADNVPGTAFSSPLRTEVVLNLAHFSIDVTAPELVHAEVAKRLGFRTRAVRLPVWFDEGVAVQHDRRVPYLLDCGAVGAQRIREVRQLTTARRFWHCDRSEIVRHYQAARCAAAEVLERHPPRTLYASLARLSQGEPFDTVFGHEPANPH